VFLACPTLLSIADPAGQGDDLVMLEHVAVHGVQGGIVDVRLEDPLAQTVEHHDLGHPTQPAKGLLVQFGPDL
jgi:hypothetical protein